MFVLTNLGTTVAELMTPNRSDPDDRPPCPQCGSNSVAVYLYGLPDMLSVMADVAAGRIVLGGCVIAPGNPEYRCNVCDHDWGTSRASTMAAEFGDRFIRESLARESEAPRREGPDQTEGSDT